MSADDTPRLRLGQMVDGQELDAMAINEALIRLDVLTDACFKGQFANTPPSSPADGDAYLLGAAPTGAWSGQAYKIASCLDGAWRFHIPFDGMRAVVLPGGTFIYYSGGSWINFMPPPSSVAFPATQISSADPNTLDDYEEGSFTPTLAFGGASTGIGYNFRSGYYTKKGDDVSFSVTLNLTSKGTATGNMTIGGLPFAVAALSNYRTSAAVLVDGMTGLSGAPVSQILGGGTTIYLYCSNSGSVTSLTNAHATDSSFVAVGGVYKTAT
jgi:hypothetical protein